MALQEKTPSERTALALAIESPRSQVLLGSPGEGDRRGALVFGAQGRGVSGAVRRRQGRQPAWGLSSRAGGAAAGHRGSAGLTDGPVCGREATAEAAFSSALGSAWLSLSSSWADWRQSPEQSPKQVPDHLQAPQGGMPVRRNLSDLSRPASCTQQQPKYDQKKVKGRSFSSEHSF